MARFLGLDIGGANLKLSDGEQQTQSLAFPLWKTPERLADTLRMLIQKIQKISPPEGFAVTMTGELADCFETKAEGVDFILGAVEQVADGRPLAVWQTGAEFVSPEIAREIPLLVAAANWHALATWVGRMQPEGLSLLLDMGSTTTDIVPLWDGVPIPTGLTDRERLIAGELVYTGVRRTPLCAASPAVPFQDAMCPVAAELFATMQDVYLILGQIEEDKHSRETANGKPATREAAHDRLARMICCDRTELNWEAAVVMAEHFAAEQRRQITAAVQRVLSEQQVAVSQVVISGSGGFVLSQVCEECPALQAAERTFLNRLFPQDVAEAACAFAVARLAAERVLGD